MRTAGVSSTSPRIVATTRRPGDDFMVGDMTLAESWSKLQNIIGPILTYLATFVVATGGFGAIIYGLFKVFAEKWLNEKFEERLSAYKHAQQKELEQLKSEINALMDRTVRLHQREFDVIPEAWGLLTEAFNLVRPVALGAGLSSRIEGMTAEQFDDFLEKIPLANWQKRELRASSEKTSYYLDAIMWHDLNRAQELCGNFHVYLSKNGIFIPPAIKEKFSALDDLLAECIGERRRSLQDKTASPKFEKGMSLHDNGPKLLKSLERDVQGRLWSSKVDAT
jgi:hypothetical protein